MKVCVCFNPKEKNDNFEGTRLRKNIKGALELADVPYAKSIIDTYDLIHFISLDDEHKINDAYEEGVPTVFSALYCESDNSASILNKTNTLTPKAIKLLDKINVVLVSDNKSKELLVNNGVTSDIKIVTPGVNISRFEFPNSLEGDIFYNYYQLEKDKKFIAVIGTYDDSDVKNQLIEIAKEVPYPIFYFGNAKVSYVSRLMHKIPANLRFCTLINNELYCSMMKHASVYIALDNNKHSPITLLDAMASKTQIFALKPLGLNEEMLSDKFAYVADNIVDLSNLINQYLKGEIPSKINESYKYAKKNSLKYLSKELINIYQKLIDGRNVK